VSTGAVPLLLSRLACTELTRETRLRCGRVLHKVGNGYVQLLELGLHCHMLERVCGAQ
jgi:hypothetical protein